MGDSRASWRLESGLSESVVGVLLVSRTAATVRAMAAAAAAAPMRNRRRCSGLIDVAVNMVCVCGRVLKQTRVLYCKGIAVSV